MGLGAGSSSPGWVLPRLGVFSTNNALVNPPSSTGSGPAAQAGPHITKGVLSVINFKNEVNAAHRLFIPGRLRSGSVGQSRGRKTTGLSPPRHPKTWEGKGHLLQVGTEGDEVPKRDPGAMGRGDHPTPLELPEGSQGCSCASHKP